MTRTGKYWLMAFVVLLSIFSFSNLNAWQKSIRFDRITVADGLPGAFARSIVQDKRGFMWFATSNGLAKYDGYRFTVYRHDLDDPGSVSSNEILSVFEDHQGTLWVGTDAGLDRFDREQEIFKHFTHDPEDVTTLGGPVVPTIYEDRQGVLWIGHWFAGLSKFDRATETFVRYKHDPNAPDSLNSSQNLMDIVEDRNGMLWVGFGGDGLNRVDRATGSVAAYQNDPENPGSLESNNVLALHADRSGDLWVGTTSGLNLFDPVTETFEFLSYDDVELDSGVPNPNQSGVVSIAEDKEGLLWLASDTAVHHYDPIMGSTVHYRSDPENPDGLHGDNFGIRFIADDGAVWIKSQSAGINVFNPTTATVAN